MSFSQHLVLWLHVAFVIFTIGPVTLAIMSTPRYIRQRDIRILRYLSRMTFIFAAGSLGVLIAGFALASMMSKAGKPWIIVSGTLFLVAVVLLGLIHRDQRHAIKALEAAAETAATAVGLADEQVSATVADQPPGAGTPAGAEPATATGPQQAAADPAAVIPPHLASVERGRIAMLGGVVSLIWLVILVLMVWNS
ncbi:MAG TPA: hypothetical protein VMU94_12040 [Streptosporangiaceae bacterium]|nr:hypothetical protein [Streptosporangiaceae bacterium]